MLYLPPTGGECLVERSGSGLFLPCIYDIYFVIGINLHVWFFSLLLLVDVRSEDLANARWNTLDCAYSVHRYVWD